MTKFEVGQRVKLIANPIDQQFIGAIGTIKSLDDSFGEEAIMYNVKYDNFGRDGFEEDCYCEVASNIELAQPETSVTEFKPGDRVRIIRNRNAFGNALSWLQDTIGTEVTLGEHVEVNEENQHGDWEAFEVVETDFWVRSDDIELVERKTSETTSFTSADKSVKLEDGDFSFTTELNFSKGEKLPKYKELLLGGTTTNFAHFSFTRSFPENPKNFSVSIKIREGFSWVATDLRELADHLNKLAKRIDKKVAKQQRGEN